MALRKVAVAALALAAAALWAPPRGAEAINTRPSEELAGGGLVPAAFLEQLSVCSSEAVAAQGGATCCGGFQCPYAGGVCCGSDAAFCCPMGTVCLPSGGAVAPQCGTPSRPVSGPGAVPGLLGTPGGVPSEPSSAAQAAARAAAAAASSAAPSSTSVPGGSGPVEWQQVRDASDSGAPDEVNLEKLGPKVKRTKFPVKLFLDIANLVYPFYLAKSNVLDLELRQDVARTENMAVQSVDVASVAPLRLRTDGSPADEKGLKIPVPGAAPAPAAAAKARFAEEGFVPVSGVRAEIILYCGNEGHARAVARHLFLTVDGQTPEPLALTSLSAEPLDARANAALPFSALPSSRVLVGDAEYNDRSGRQVADRAQKDLAAIKAKEQLVLSSVQTLAKQVESQRRQLVDASAAEQRAADAAEQARKKADADEKARRAAEEAKKAADREDVLRRAAAAASREAQEQAAKDATAKQRADEKAQEEAAKAKQASIKADWDMRAKPLELEQGVRVCGDGNDRVPQYALAGELCVLSGAVCADTDNHRPLASAPRDCRPSGRLVFNRHDSSRRTWRADAFVTGRVAWNGGETTYPNATLDGIFYAVQGSNLTAPLELGASWVPAGGEFAAPTAFVQDGFCALSGAAALKSGDGSKWVDADNVIAVVPAECRPDSRLVFNVAHHKLTVRVDVLPNGKVVYVDGARTYKWVSLDGIGYYANSTNATNYAPLALRGGYKAFGMGYRTPSVSFKAQLCALSGVVTGSTAADIAVLPANCRPASGALSFWLNQGSRAFEIDILQDGTVRRILPAYDSWISLDGVVFAAGNPQAWEGQVKSKAFTELQAQRAATAEKAKADAAAEAGAKKDAALKAEAEQKAAAKKPTF